MERGSKKDIGDKMGQRDIEISRIRKYCEAIGVKLVMRNKPNKNAAAEWHLDGTQITVFLAQPENKLNTVLSLIHEIGHHLWHVYQNNREEDLKITEAYSRITLSRKKTHSTEADRRIVLNVERAGITYWDVIVRDLDIKIPTWRIEYQKAVDIWHYEYYYENGCFPNRVVSREKLKELKVQFKT